MNGCFREVAVAGALCLAATGAGAVDFRDGAWSGAEGQPTFTVGDVTATADCQVAAGCDGVGFLDLGSYDLSQSSTTGLGIQGTLFGNLLGAADEIDRLSFDSAAAEVLKIDFAAPVALGSMLITNLFDEEFFSFQYLEIGSYSLDGGQSWTDFFALAEPPNNPNGELLIDLGGAVTDQVWFRVPDGHSQSVLSEFSVAAITPVPEPATLLLLGSGLVGLGGIARRRLQGRESA
jgi:hypothetical protein